MVPVLLKPERMAQLEEYAHRRGQAPAAALDELLAEYLDCEQQDYQQAVTGIRQGYADLQAGRTKPAEEV
jgi:predicted transcriptional regulator